MPAILAKVIDELIQNISFDNVQSLRSAAAGKLVRDLRALSDSITHNHQFPLVPYQDIPNTLLFLDAKEQRWLDAPWLVSECLMYMFVQYHVSSYFELDGLDVFQRQKQVRCC